MVLSAFLRGVHVVTLAQNVPGPLAAQRLARGGASVRKIEPPAGDPLLTLAPAWHAEMHVGVSIERLDLKLDAGRAALLAHLAHAQVLLTSQRPSALVRLGLDTETLHRAVPVLRILRIVGSLEYPDEPGHDLTYQAAAGLLGDDMPRALVADVMTSERVYAGVLALLRMPEGTVLDVGMVESLDAMQASLRHGLTVPGAALGGGWGQYGLYDCREGRVAVAALEPHFAARLRDTFGSTERQVLAARFLERTADEWAQWARQHDLPITAVSSSDSTVSPTLTAAP